MNTKNACSLSKHSSLNICTPRSFQAIDSPPPPPPPRSLFSPSLPHLIISFLAPASSQACLLTQSPPWGGSSQADRECHRLLSQHITLSFRVPSHPFSPIFHTSTKAHAHTYAMISIACPNNILEECKYQRSISPFSHYMLVCVCLARRCTITQQSMCALAVEVCVFLC